MNTDDVDFDLLADYVGGALDGTPDAERVAHLVDTDPAWGAAYAELSAGMAAVTGQLRELGDVPMPDDVARRLAVALETFHHAPAPALEGRHLHAVPSSSSPSAARNRRWRRWAVPVSAAAGVLAFAGFAGNYLINHEKTADQASSAPAAALPEPAQGQADTFSGQAEAFDAALGRVIVSGTDYDPDTLKVIAPVPTNAEYRADTRAYAASVQPRDPALQRLAGQDALLDCLVGIGAEHGAPVTAYLVDYARYQGAPALIVRFTSADGEWVWVSGPACGASDAATVTSVRVR